MAELNDRKVLGILGITAIIAIIGMVMMFQGAMTGKVIGNPRFLVDSALTTPGQVLANPNYIPNTENQIGYHQIKDSSLVAVDVHMIEPSLKPVITEGRVGQEILANRYNNQ